MPSRPPTSDERRLWRSVIALNLVSGLSQFGQYGLGSTLLPLALQARGASPWAIGVVSSAFWCGMALGLLSARGLLLRLGDRATVSAGMVLSALAFALMPWLPASTWACPALFIGLGLGWRWIGNETWLYRLIPGEARGRIVGVHETVIGIASVLGPMAVAALGPQGPAAFGLAAVVCLAATLPLPLAQTAPPLVLSQTPNASPNAATAASAHPDASRSWSRLPSALGPPRRAQVALWRFITHVSPWAVLAGLGGWMEGGLLSQLGVVSAHAGQSSAAAAQLMTVLGLGAMLCQLPIGWCSDRLGERVAAWICIAAAMLGSALPVVQPELAWMLPLSAFLLGGASAGLLTLGMVHAAQGPQGDDVARRVQQVSLVYTLLSACGPVAAGALIEGSGHIQSLWLQLLLLSLICARVLVVSTRGRYATRRLGDGRW